MVYQYNKCKIYKFIISWINYISFSVICYWDYNSPTIINYLKIKTNEDLYDKLKTFLNLLNIIKEDDNLYLTDRIRENYSCKKLYIISIDSRKYLH